MRLDRDDACADDFRCSGCEAPLAPPYRGRYCGACQTERTALGMPTRCRECGAWTRARVTDARGEIDMVALSAYVVLGALCPACAEAGAGANGGW